jgi:hypothetical protein
MVWAILGTEILCVFGLLSLLISFTTAEKPGKLRRTLFTKQAQDAPARGALGLYGGPDSARGLNVT